MFLDQREKTKTPRVQDPMVSHVGDQSQAASARSVQVSPRESQKSPQVPLPGFVPPSSCGSARSHNTGDVNWEEEGAEEEEMLEKE